MENYNRIVKDFWKTRYYLNNDLHRIEGPAIEYANGDKEWFQNGKQHRIGGPAVEEMYGTKEWYQNGLLHRTDGPAREWDDGTKEWWQNGKRHRIEGPAVEFIKDGYKNMAWYYQGKLVNCNSQEEFERFLKLEIFW